jgi:hypothetical protein
VKRLPSPSPTSNYNNANTTLPLKFPSATSSSLQPVPSPYKNNSENSYGSSSSSSNSNNTKSSVVGVGAGGKARCTRIVLAGSSNTRGIRSSVFSKCACDNLRCLSCNFKVQFFIGKEWNETAVDYMFFRNNALNEQKLSAQLIQSSDDTAYCCQCTWTKVNGERTLIQGASGDPQWTCAGH